MKRTLLLVLTLALLTAAATRLSTVSAQDGAPLPAAVATDGAFRDGLYLGRLDAAQGRAHHVSVGRWAVEADRAQFRAGYEAGYRNAATTIAQ
jgi:hypothetical protein